MSSFSASSLRLVREQSFVTVVTAVSQVTSSVLQAVTVTQVQFQQQQTSIAAVGSDSQASTSLSTGWIVAIVSLIALAISVSYQAIKCWSGRSAGYSSSRFDNRSSAYYEMTRPSEPRGGNSNNQRYSNRR